jgi:acetyl esterase/lipase
MRRWLIALAALAGLAIGAAVLSPWPGVVLIRAIFDRGAAAAAAALAPLVPVEVATTTHTYDPADPDAVLDIHRPPAPREGGPLVVWIHGGGFVSGRRGDLDAYTRILSGRGFTVVNLDYTIAPEATYPTPIRQANTALAWLQANAADLGIDPSKIVLAGDSAGAQIAAQTAAIVTNPDYASRLGIAPGITPGRLAGALLFCGVYDISGMGGKGLLGWFVHTTAWAYSGTRSWRTDPDFATMSVTPWLTPAFPPAFISAGNADPLAPQSVALAAAIRALGIPADTLFFPPGYAPPLAHEYQFDLSTPAGRDALARAVAWLEAL